MADPAAASRQIVASLHHIITAQPRYQCIALFAALTNEPDLLPLLELFPERQWVLPRVTGDTMEFHQIRDASELIRGAWNISEPSPRSPLIRHSNIDLFLCPGLAFTHEGRRLGKGKGFYDRYLAQCAQARPPCYGICFSDFLVAHIPCDEHDITMDAVICEKGGYGSMPNFP